MHKYTLGKVDYEGTGRKNCEAAITWEIRPDGEFSMCAEIWMPSKRDIYCGGQCVDTVAAYFPDDAKAQRMLAIWRRWHLNHMRAGCEHQRGADMSRTVEVVSYGLTTAAYQLRKDAIDAAAAAGLKGEPLNISETARALANLTTWFKDIHTPPDADSPLSGCYEVKKRETKAIGWVYPHEHPEGMLTRACDVCGYKYGSAWLREELPAEVRAEIESWSEIGVPS